jgi:nicotinate-nucleotide--dimethylbenzimidazole phosphoribosyltransferase
MPAFTSVQSFRAALMAAPVPDTGTEAAARDRQGQLTKPPGSLGRLEELAVWYATWRGTPRPVLDHPQIIIFAGNHGVAARGVSAFPAAVTAQMVANFRAGGAAINQLARAAGARLDVIALDLDQPTADFTEGPAMTGQAFIDALSAGWDAVDPAADLLVVGEMGIGNTTSAAAIACALFGGAAADWVGRGTGVDDAGLRRKAEVVAAGVARHGQGTPFDILRGLGGREIAAMAGALARARVDRIPVLLDGFIACAAAAVLHQAVPGSLDHAVAGHLSAEGAHGALLARLGKTPVLSLDMRLGEGSGAAVAIGILKAAVACHSGMATFAEAGVSGG